MLHVDITPTLAKVLTPSIGISDQDLLGQRTSMKRCIGDWVAECQAGHHAWTQDIFHDRVLEQVERLAQRIAAERIETIVWIGIGGSGLGPRVLQEVFETPSTLECIVIDTIDPSILALTREVVDWRHALIVVASKSGETLETMSAFFYFWEALVQARGDKAATHVIALTDPHEGLLRGFCLDHGIELLPIPKDVGGRYSIFTPVGLLLLSLLQADMRAFVQGAIDMDTACQNTTLEENPAALLATAQFLLETKKGYLVRVIMPYSQRLQSIARWNQQLIAESLGKTELHNPIPLAAIGTQDQHSLLQQWTQGPRKSWHLFIREMEKPRVFVPSDLPPEWKHIAGKSFGQLLDACYEGTSQALTAAKRAHASISITRLDAYHLGQLFYCLLVEVVLLGKLYRIDPYGQPGVELSKKLTRSLLTHTREL